MKISHAPQPAFTLIELLIVVAIIAILAAIAVPNFLEAQTRAKVSRDKADMRTLATALEAYRIDANNYPLDWNAYFDRAIDPPGIHAIHSPQSLHTLTTPVSYLTALPQTAFKPFMTEFQSQLAPLNLELFDHFFYDGPDAVDFYRNFTFAQFPFEVDRTEWFLSSPGPNRFYDSIDTAAYDPTNGTVSEGNLFRSNGGIEEGA
jgi:type II secretion system protein G